MILVRLQKYRAQWSFVPSAQAATQPAPSTADDQSGNTDTSETTDDTSESERVEMVAIGLARSEPEG